MTSAYILITAILVLGAVIATLGDRIGTKVGKARLSLFNLRPRNTATLVTIITGSLISASTLLILFATSESLREGVFKLDDILKKLRIASGEVDIINAEKVQVESELTEAQAQLKDISKQGTVLRSEINSLLDERQELIQKKNQLNQQISQLKSQVVQRDQELEEKNQELTQRDQELEEKNQELTQRNQELEEKNQELTQRNQEIAEQKQIIAQGESRLTEVEQQLDGAKEAIAQIETRRQELEQQLDGAKEAIAQIETRRQELEQQLNGAKEAIAQIETRRQELELELTDKEKQIAFLTQEARVLEQNYQILRQGRVAILRGQVLASGVVRIVEPDAAPEAVNQLLRQANKTAIQITQPDSSTSDERLVQIPKSQAERLIQQIQDGQDYILRILSAGNYVKGEKQIQVFADAVLNQVIFDAGDVLATISIDASTMANDEIRQRLNQLLAASEFRAGRAGILGNIQLGDGSTTKILRFIEQLEEYDEPINVRVIAQGVTYRSGPLRMQLIATQNGEVLFST